MHFLQFRSVGIFCRRVFPRLRNPESITVNYSPYNLIHQRQVRSRMSQQGATCVSAGKKWSDGFAYPDVRRDEASVFEHHGDNIADPYRWLEDPDAPETKEFVEKQNHVTNGFLRSYPHYDQLKNMVTKLHDYPRYGAPNIEGQRVYYMFNSGLQNQSVMYRQKSIDDDSSEVFFDPNTLSEDGTTSLSQTSWSEDGRLMAYMISAGGSDWRTIKVMDADTKTDLPDVLERVKFSCLEWTHDNKGFFYNMYPETSAEHAVGTHTGSDYNQKLYYHYLGTPQAKDVMCAEFPENPSWKGGVSVTDDGRYAVMSISRSCESKNAVWYCDLTKVGDIKGPLPWVKLFQDFDAEYSLITNEGSLFYIKTNLDAPNHKVMVVDVNNPDRNNWKILIPENKKYFLEWACCAAGNKLIVHYIEDVKSAMYIHNLQSGEREYAFDLGCSAVMQISYKKKLSSFFYKVQSFTNPGSVYKCDLSQSINPTIFREIKTTAFDPEQYETKQVFYPSKDAVQIPMFITFRKGLKLGPDTPCLLYAYGGFHIAVQPYFSARFVAFLKAFDGIFAVANIRGGSEYGEEWWQAGALKNKQNCFTDFQMAAEYLYQEGYTSRDKLVIMGGSNGGLLVGACCNQRPDLFGAAVPMVGVMDMLRFHKFTIGHYWTSDYGNPDEKDDYDVIIKYSPLHNIRSPDKADVQYPALLVVTADHDDRVSPLHSLKYVAELQHRLCKADAELAGRQRNPLMARIETKAGHGAGKSTTKIIEEITDTLVFCARALDYGWKGEC
ncbi:prolyl endopeptidase-like isoform X2 [Paramacrobiotus metropolitanus]|uniref:prolyl endopeptidase-like isoform X2 n=1 Tax=Paramacrobiotus metropolitanus TaxID=2943436 RepID=UPI002445AA5C|nr:prolyl endopeptidase-like isoform X2 [Paramacrobiotus metropolitanus]